MKKLLALVLALVMSMSLVTISNAAFKDADTIDNKEAVEVMNAAGVLIGDENGNFNAKANLTRGQAAKIIAYLDLGGKTADAIKGTGTAFTDVPASHWAAGYIEYCAGAGYVAGVGGGKFDPEAQVTGVQFAKMLLCALGYKAEVEGYNGTDYTIAVARDANKNDLFKSLSIVTSASLTREQAAQMAFNALKATTVEYQGGTNVTTGDTTVVVNAVRNEVKRTSGNDYRNGTAETATGTQQLVEKLYGTDLKYASTGIADAMNRPAHSWSWKNVEIGKYTDTADYTLVVSKKDKTFDYWIDTISNDFTTTGTIIKVNGDDTGVAATTTANVGDIVEIYMNDTSANQVDVAVVTRYSAAKVTGAVATKTTDNVEQVRVPGVVNSYTDIKRVNGYEGLAKNDVVYYYTADGNTYLAKAASFEGKLTSVNASDAKKITVDSTAYVVNGSITVSPAFNTTYTFYTDNNGYVVFAIEKEDEKSDYVVMQAIGAVKASGVSTGDSAEARLVAQDGTTKVVPVKSVKINNTVISGTDSGTDSSKLIHNSGTTPAINGAVSAKANKAFFTYTINSDKEYELTEVVENASDKITVGAPTGKVITNKAAMDDAHTVAFTDKTVFIVAKTSDGKTFDVYTGKDAVPSMTGANYAYVAKSGSATYVFVDHFTTKTGSGNSIYFLNGTASTKVSAKNSDNQTYYYVTMKAVVNGEITDVKVKADSSFNVALSTGSISTGALVDPTYDTDTGVITAVTASASEAKDAVNGYSYENGTLVAGTAGYSCAADAAVFYKDEDGNYVKGTIADYASDDNDTIYVVTKGTTGTNATTVDYIYIQYVDDGTVALAKVFVEDGVPTTATTATNSVYTLNAASGAYSDAIWVTPADSHATVSVSATQNGTYTAATADGSGNWHIGNSAASAGTINIFVKVTAVDGSNAIYKVSVITVA